MSIVSNAEGLCAKLNKRGFENKIPNHSTFLQEFRTLVVPRHRPFDF